MSAVRLAAAAALALCGAFGAGSASAQATASPYTSATRYDAAGQVTGTIAPDPDGGGPLRHAAVRNTYDLAGRLVTVEQGELSDWQSEQVAPEDWVGFTVLRRIDTAYDAMSRKTREALTADGVEQTLTQYSYDQLGRLDCTAVRMNPAAFAAAPAACELGAEGSHGPDRITKNIYDEAGQRLQVREGMRTGWEAAPATWSYNGNGQITEVIDGKGNRAVLRYDGHGRQDRWTFPSTTRPSAFDDVTPANPPASFFDIAAPRFTDRADKPGRGQRGHRSPGSKERHGARLHALRPAESGSSSYPLGRAAGHGGGPTDKRGCRAWPPNPPLLSGTGEPRHFARDS